MFDNSDIWCKIYLIHGTWSLGEVWYDSAELISELKKICGHPSNCQDFIYRWSGGNLPKYRFDAAEKLFQEIRSIGSDIQLYKKNILTLVGHSHGGTVAIHALNIGLASWALQNNVRVNLITLNTPVIRSDNPKVSLQYGTSINELHTTVPETVRHFHIYTSDLVQHKGGASFVKNGKSPIGIGWLNGGTFSKSTDYLRNRPGAAYRTFKNDTTVNIKYRPSIKIYKTKKYPQYPAKINLAGITMHQGWRAGEVKKWLPKLKQAMECFSSRELV